MKFNNKEYKLIKGSCKDCELDNICQTNTFSGKRLTHILLNESKRCSNQKDEFGKDLELRYVEDK